MKKTEKPLLTLLVLIITFTIHAQKKEDSNAYHFGATYTGDLVSNFSGGIKTGSSYLGMATIYSGFETEKAKWWKGGEAFLKIANTHGGEPSATLVGDFQGVSNIEAGNLSWLYELWYKQNLGNLNIIVGLQDLNINFASSENGALFTNSSFGVHSSIADNIPSPIFPLTALGLNVQWQMAKDFMLQAAVFDGTPDDFENNPYNISWRLGKTDGYLAVTELLVNRTILKDKTGSYKFGGYFHQHSDFNITAEKNFGFYFVGDQELTKNISIFSQIGISPKSLNQHNHFYSFGLNYKGFSNNRQYDQLGIAMAYAGIDGNDLGSETAVELTYLYQLCSNIYIRPDIQYIINPAGSSVKLKNALVGFIRFGVEF